MGNFLDQPNRTKQSECGESKLIKYALSGMQGWRISMEDTLVAKLSIDESNPKLCDWSFFALFDGHAGISVSSFAANSLLSHILRNDKFLNFVNSYEEEFKLSMLIGGIHEAFLSLDELMRNDPEIILKKGGSTAVAVIIAPKHIFFINCGDSRAMLASDELSVPQLITKDHKPSDPGEESRIKVAGGSVVFQRINGTLAVSRALGDFHFKELTNCSPDLQLVSPIPDILYYSRKPEKDEFILLVCDGITDVVTSEELILHTRNMLRVESNLEKICSDIIDICLYKGSRDNMSVILILLDSPPKLDEHAIEEEKKLESVFRSLIKELAEKQQTLSLKNMWNDLRQATFEYVPSPGGFEVKQPLIEKLFYELFPASKDEVTENANKV